MLRLACCFLTEEWIRVCAPIHDAVLVEAPLAELDAVVSATQAAMAKASEIVLGGFRLRSDSKIIRYADRYEDPRGLGMWNTISEIVARLKAESNSLSSSYICTPTPNTPTTLDHPVASKILDASCGRKVPQSVEAVKR